MTKLYAPDIPTHVINLREELAKSAKFSVCPPTMPARVLKTWRPDFGIDPVKSFELNMSLEPKRWPTNVL